MNNGAIIVVDLADWLIILCLVIALASTLYDFVFMRRAKRELGRLLEDYQKRVKPGGYWVFVDYKAQAPDEAPR